MDYELLLAKYNQQLLRSLQHLEYSYKKISTLDSLPSQLLELSDETLEVWEGFMARFARTCDIFLSKYLRTKLLREDPGFTGSLRDHLNQAEKLGFIDDAQTWLNIRELHNLQAHEYAEEKLYSLFNSALQEAPHLLALKSSLQCPHQD